MTYETLAVSRADAALVAMLNRPDRRNAIGFGMMQELIAVAEACGADASLAASTLKNRSGTVTLSVNSIP